MRTIDELIRLWPTASEFARDIGVKPNHLQTMRVRDSLPVDYWQRAIDAAKRRRIRGVNWDSLNALRAAVREAS